MRLTKKLIAKIKIYNAYEYANGSPYISYRPNDSTGWRTSGWQLIHPNHKFKEAHWSDNGSLMFSNWSREDKNEKLLEAQKKFIEIFGETEFAKTPFGSWMDKIFVDRRNKEITNLLKDIGE